MNTTPSANSKNILNSDVEITGTLKFNGELTFDGKLNGDIASEGILNLGDNAVIKGNLNVNSVVLRGKINGNITARDKIEIKAGTELFGDIRSAKLAIEEGVTYVGKTEVNPSKPPPLRRQRRRAATPPTPRGAKAGGSSVRAGAPLVTTFGLPFSFLSSASRSPLFEKGSTPKNSSILWKCPYRDVPHQLAAACKKCLARDLSIRYENVEELIAEIKNLY